MLRSIIDPHLSAIRSAPSTERDLMIAASNAQVLAFDNLSTLSAGMSDALCRLATGGGFATRELFTDGDEKIIAVSRPTMLNGIEQVGSRGDLLERSLQVVLSPVDETERMTERELWSRFERAHPRILGALLDGVSAALRELPAVKLDRLPRMADFAEWVVAAETALPWKRGAFLRVLSRNAKDADAIAIESSPIGRHVVRLLDTHDGPWEGMISELLSELNARADEAVMRSRSWPTSPRALRGHLDRIAPALAKHGFLVQFHARNAKGSRVVLQRIDTSPTAPTRPTLNKAAWSSGTTVGHVGPVGRADGVGTPTSGKIVFKYDRNRRGQHIRAAARKARRSQGHKMQNR
jgi:hypothetical protein